MSRIGFDIDNVMNYLDRFLSELVHEHFGVQLDGRRWTSYLIEDSFPEISKDQVNYLFEEISMGQGQALERLKSNQTAIETVHSIAKQHEVSFITSRPESIRSHTYAWMERNNLGMFTADTYFDFAKVETAKKLGLDLFVEDAPHIAKGIADAGIPVLLYWKTWNKDVRHPNIEHLCCWDSAYEKILQKINAH